MMKRITTVILTFILLFSFPIKVSAEEQKEAVLTSGYTEEGIYYEVYGSLYSIISSNSISVTRNVVYSGNVDPASQVSWQETIDGVSYSGILHLINYYYDKASNKTTATYSGTLTAD